MILNTAFEMQQPNDWATKNVWTTKRFVTSLQQYSFFWWFTNHQMHLEMDYMHRWTDWKQILGNIFGLWFSEHPTAFLWYSFINIQNACFPFDERIFIYVTNRKRMIFVILTKSTNLIKIHSFFLAFEIHTR